MKVLVSHMSLLAVRTPYFIRGLHVNPAYIDANPAQWLKAMVKTQN